MKPETILNRKLLARIDRWVINESVILSIYAILVGVASAAGVWLFKELIDLFNQLTFGILHQSLQPLGGWTVVLLPLIGGLTVGLIRHFFVGEERHHGVAGIMQAVALAGGRLRYRRVPAKSIAAAISIGSGASVGPEDPSVQIGANLGSMLGQRLRLSDERIRALVAAGAAAGIAAAFNAPIAGVFFALEIVLGEIGGSAFSVVAISSVASAVVTQAISGSQPAFRVPAYAFHSALELPLYLGLGLLAGPIAALYVRLLYLAQDFFQNLHIPRWIKPGMAGLAVGLTGIFWPQIFGVGYETIELLLEGRSIEVGLLLTLLFVKMALTAVSIGGGFMGGVFAPSLFLGATLGSAFGVAADALFPGLPITPPAFALVGMAAVLAGAVHAPLTAVILLFEMTNDYRIILPLMFSVTISLLISQRLQRDSVYAFGLARKGIRLDRGRDIEVLESITVGEVMQKPAITLQETLTVSQASEILSAHHYHGLPVLDSSGNLVGIFTIRDVEQAANEGKLAQRIATICTREPVIAYPDESISQALRRMSLRDLGRLPIVARDNPRHLLGILRRSDVIRSYDLALTRRAALRHRAHQVRLGAVSGEEVSITEMVVEPGAPCANRRVQDVVWPRDCVIATLRRGQQLLIPHGDTILLAGDTLVAVAEGEARQSLKSICLSANSQGESSD